MQVIHKIILFFQPLLRIVKEELLDIFGSSSFKELLESLVFLKYFKLTLAVSVIFASMEKLVKEWTGLHGDVYLLFVFGIVMDTLMTFYILLLVHNQKQIAKAKILGKSIFKILFYSFLFVALHRFNLKMSSVAVFTLNFDVFDWIEKVVITFIFIQLLLGLISKANDAGFEETKGILKFFSKKFPNFLTTKNGDEDKIEDGTNEANKTLKEK